MKKRLKINGFIIFLVIVLIALFPKVFFRKVDAYLSDGVAEVFGIAFILLGQIFRASARGYKSEYSRQGEALIQGGPYTLVRNPMYLGILLIGLGIVLVLFKWWAIFIFLLVFTMRYILLIFKEEKNLKILFPKIYQDYCKKVPRILPLPKALLTQDISEYLPLRFSWLKKEIGSILTVLLLTFCMELFEEIKNRSVKTYLTEMILIAPVVIFFIYLINHLIKRTGSLKKDVSN